MESGREILKQYNVLVRAGYALASASAWPGRVAAWLILIIIVTVLGAVLGGLYRMNVIIEWGGSIPLFGEHLTLTGVTELQWHLFGVMVMLGGAYAVFTDRHIRVDFLYSRLPTHWQRIIDLVGDLVFLIPFCIFVAWLSQNFIHIAYISGEKSDYGGLVDRYLIKTIIPIGFTTLGIAAVGRVLGNLGMLWESIGKAKGDKA